MRLCGHVRLRRPGQRRPRQRAEVDHEHDAPAGRGPGLALGPPHSGQVQLAVGAQPDYPDTVCDGLWEYRPDFTSDLWKKGATTIENIVSGPEGLRAEEGKTGTIVWTMRSPYIFVGGRFEVEGSGAVLEVSEDGKKWVDARRKSGVLVLHELGTATLPRINSAAGSPAPPGSSDWR